MRSGAFLALFELIILLCAPTSSSARALNPATGSEPEPLPNRPTPDGHIPPGIPAAIYYNGGVSPMTASLPDFISPSASGASFYTIYGPSTALGTAVPSALLTASSTPAISSVPTLTAVAPQISSMSYPVQMASSTTWALSSSATPPSQAATAGPQPANPIGGNASAIRKSTGLASFSLLLWAAFLL